ncbi:MAG: retropepsin-like aspartic protease family protein [Microcoleaceae cyanobacterium]
MIHPSLDSLRLNFLRLSSLRQWSQFLVPQMPIRPPIRSANLLWVLVGLGNICFGQIGTAIAQERPGCFFRTQSGEYLDLNNNEICPVPVLEVPAGGVERGAAVAPGSGVYQAKIVRRSGGIPVIQVMFNGTQPYEMLVDTGASNTVITPTMAEVLGVLPTGRTKANTPSQKNVELEVGLVRSVNVEGAVASNLLVAIAPALDIGLLGQDFFGKYDVTIKQDVIEFRERAR